MRAEVKKNNHPIGVFDSGVGGLSVLRELQQLLPNENFVFFADQVNMPYGEKSKKQLVRFTQRITDFLINKHNIKLLVVACNTATCSTIQDLRARYHFPIVGTVPAIKTAAGMSKSKNIAVISTPSTSKSEMLRTLIKDCAQNIKVQNISCKNLADVIDAGDLEDAKLNTLLAKYLRKIKDSNIDRLVLGSTHYVFLKSAIGKLLGSKVKLIDGNIAIAKQTRSLLSDHMLDNNSQKRGKTLYFTTGDPAQFSKVASKLLDKKIRAEKIRI